MAAASAPTQAASETADRPIAPGVHLVQTVVPVGAPGGPLLVTAVIADPRTKGVRIEAALAQDRIWGTDRTSGREAVSALVARRGAIAGINASFFPYTGVPIGLFVHDSELFTEPGYNRSVFWIGKDGATHFDVLTFRGTIRNASDETIAISGLNRPLSRAGRSEVVLYTPRFFDFTFAEAGRFGAVLNVDPADWPLPAGRDVAATVTRTAEDGGLPLQPGTVVLDGVGEGAEFLRRSCANPNARLTLRLDIRTAAGQPFDLSAVREAVAGGPRLLTSGTVAVSAASEGFSRTFADSAYARSAVGVTADGRIVLATVDGRQPGVSRGVSLAEMAARMQSLGCVDAMNLDGGGSTSLSVRGAVVNSPSDYPERPVASALLVVADGAAPKTPVAFASPAAGDGNGIAPPLGWRKHMIGDTVALPDGDVTWGVTGGIGYVTQADRRLHVTHAGRGAVVAVAGSPNAAPAIRIAITVVAPATPAPPTLRVVLKLTKSADGGSAILSVRVLNPDGDPLPGEPVDVSVVGGKLQSVRLITGASGEGTTNITWDGKTPPSQRSITVTSPTGRFTSTGFSAEKTPKP